MVYSLQELIIHLKLIEFIGRCLMLEIRIICGRPEHSQILKCETTIKSFTAIYNHDKFDSH